MKYLINESKLEALVFKYLDKLIKVNSLEIKQHPLFDYKLICKQNGKLMFFIDKRKQEITFDKTSVWQPLQDFFNLDSKQMHYYTEKWAEQNLNLEDYSSNYTQALTDTFFFGR